MTIEHRTCGTCKHKGEAIPDDLGEPTTYFLCGRVQFYYELGYNKRFGPGERALVQDGSGYAAALCVEDDFGCNLWEPKDGTPPKGR